MKASESVRIRRAGWFLVAIGLLLTLGMGYLTASLGPSLLHPGDSFTGTARQGMNIFILFAMIIVFGLHSVAGGVQMIRSGKRSILTIVVTAILALAIFAWGYSITSSPAS